MNVLVCAACGRPLTEPVRPLPELPERPAYDGLPDADGSRHAPSTVPRGTYAVDPEPSGAPFVPHPDPDWFGSAVPGVCVLDPDGPGCLMSAGPRGTLVVHPEDTRGHLLSHPDVHETGCCGRPGREGPNEVCGGCGSPVATEFSECSGPYETHFLPGAVRVEAAP
ncbi:hypothetical protein AB0L04_13980 [Streptomyces glaucescens]|uniref:hypothetical protein n=1 Tax=Streptomyces glaucescens TaxID=1907 RepID=UPI00344B527F